MLLCLVLVRPKLTEESDNLQMTRRDSEMKGCHPVPLTEVRISVGIAQEFDDPHMALRCSEK